jgi:hypothetical protein
MERPTISNTNAVFQAGSTIGTYLSQAIEEIDKRLGDGYATKHPELIAECVRSQTMDFNNTSITAALYQIADAIMDRVSQEA